MRWVCAFAVLLGFAMPSARARQTASPTPQGPTTLTVETTLVEVPVLVKTKAGEPVFALTAQDFVLTDDGEYWIDAGEP